VLLPTPQLEDHPLSFVRGCLFIIFAAGCRSSIRNLRSRLAVVTATHLTLLILSPQSEILLSGVLFPVAGNAVCTSSFEIPITLREKLYATVCVFVIEITKRRINC
jgi:hypothetical protein